MSLTDPMLFEQVRDNVTALLEANQGAYFRTISYQKQRTDASEVKNNNRTAQIFFESGDFDDGSSGKQEKEHRCEYQIYLTVSSPVTADLSVLKDDEASAAAKQAALAGSTMASYNADRSLDELWRMVAQILLDPANRALGFDDTPNDRGSIQYTCSRLKLDNFRKNAPVDHGNLVVLTAEATFKTTVTETFDGASVTPAADSPVNYGTGISEPDGDPTTTPSNFDVDS